MSPRTVILLLAILVTIVGVSGAFFWGLFVGVRAVLGVLLRLGLAIIILVILFALVIAWALKR
ncbi:MAG: hypothetical protein QXO86_06570 [Nitrososphaerota archaeon]